jgi:hypothetical protein
VQGQEVRFRRTPNFHTAIRLHRRKSHANSRNLTIVVGLNFRTSHLLQQLQLHRNTTSTAITPAQLVARWKCPGDISLVTLALLRVNRTGRTVRDAVFSASSARFTCTHNDFEVQLSDCRPASTNDRCGVLS